MFLFAGFLPWSISQRYSRLPDERYHVPDLRTLPQVLQGSLGPETIVMVKGTTLSFLANEHTANKPQVYASFFETVLLA